MIDTIYSDLINLKNQIQNIMINTDNLIKNYDEVNMITIRLLSNKWILFNVTYLYGITYGKLYDYIKKVFNIYGNLYMVVNNKKIIKPYEENIDNELINLIKLSKEIYIIKSFELIT